MARILKPDEPGFIKCSIEGCERYAEYKNYQLCQKHRSRLYRESGVHYDRQSPNIIIEHDDYAELILCDMYGDETGRVKVDLDKLTLLTPYKWHMARARVERKIRVSSSLENNSELLMDRLIMNVVDKPNIRVDFINGDCFDMRIENLVLLTEAEVKQRMKAPKTNTSGIKGVSWRANKNKWRADIMVNYKQKCLGHFEKQIDAVKARAAGEIEYFGFTQITPEQIQTFEAQNKAS